MGRVGERRAVHGASGGGGAARRHRRAEGGAGAAAGRPAAVRGAWSWIASRARLRLWLAFASVPQDRRLLQLIDRVDTLEGRDSDDPAVVQSVRDVLRLRRAASARGSVQRLSGRGTGAPPMAPPPPAAAAEAAAVARW